MPDYFGSLRHVELSWAVFLLPAPLLVALLLWFAPVGPTLAARRALATLSGALTAAFVVGFAATLGNLGVGKRALLGHAFSFLRVGSFDSGLTLFLDPLALVFVLLVAVTAAVSLARLGDTATDDAARPRTLLWAVGSLIAVLADDVVVLLAGLGVATLALLLPRAGGATETGAGWPRRLLGWPLVAVALAVLAWLPGGGFTRSDYVPEGKARFGSVEARARASAPTTGARGGGDDGFLTMTGAPGSWVVLDGDGGSVHASPFVRARIPSGLHAARVVGGAASDDAELATFFVPAGAESYIAVVGATTSLREARNQLGLQATAGKLDLRTRLREQRIVGVPLVIAVFGLLAAGALLATGLGSTPHHDEPGDPAASLPALAARVLLPTYLIARAEPFASASPFEGGIAASLVAALAAYASWRAVRASSAPVALARSADALALIAVSAAFASAPGSTAVIATAATAGLLLAALGAELRTKTDSDLYLPGVALIALPPLGVTLPWGVGHATAMILASDPRGLGLAIGYALLLAATAGGLAYALLRFAPEPADDDAPANDAPKATTTTKATTKPSKKGSSKRKHKDEPTASPDEALPVAIAASSTPSRLPRLLLGLGVIAAVLGALPVGTLLGVTMPLFGWIEEGNRVHPGVAPPAIGVTLLVIVAALGGYARAQRARVPSVAARPAVAIAIAAEDDANDPLVALADALRGLRGAFGPTTLPAPSLNEGTPDDDVDVRENSPPEAAEGDGENEDEEPGS